MYDLCLLHVIVRRGHDEPLIAFFQEHNVETMTSIPCEGTASKKILSLLGLEETGKLYMYVMTTRRRAKQLMKAMVSELGLDMPGTGVAFTTPVTSIAGSSSLKHFISGQDIILEEVNDMPNAFPYELIIAIANRGYSDMVMDAARSAGAMGGTVLHAKGTNPDSNANFFGMSIADEKEMLMILTAACQKADIMRAIMEQAGVRTPAHTVMFSLPVESVAGLRSVMEAAGKA